MSALSDLSTFKLAYTIREAVVACGIGKSTLYVQIAKGNLKTRKLGSATVIRREDLQAFLDGLPPGC